MGCRTKAASRDVWLQKVLDIRWSAIFKGLVGQQQDFELNSLSNRKPMELFENGTNVVVS